MLELTSTSEPSPGPNAPQLSEAFPGLTTEEWGGVGATSHLSLPSPSNPLPLWSLGLNCWLLRQSIGTAGVIESLLHRAGLRSTGSEKCTHICTQMRFLFLLKWANKAWNICSHEAHECPEEYWVSVLAGLIFNYLCNWPQWSWFLWEPLQVCVCATIYVLGGKAMPILGKKKV